MSLQTMEPKHFASAELVESSVVYVVEVLEGLTTDVEELDTRIANALMDVDAESALFVNDFRELITDPFTER